jgi:hypothetical protein
MRPNNTSRRKVPTYSLEIHRSGAGDYSMSLLSTHVTSLKFSKHTKRRSIRVLNLDEEEMKFT